MAYKKEMFIKIIEGTAGKRYPCNACSEFINPGDEYTKINMTSKGSKGGAVKKTRTLCSKHNIKTALEIVTD